MKAAHAAGDMEAARNHSLMYNLHSKALGHEPVGPAHPDVIAHLASKPSKVYKYKAHHGDQLALSPKPQAEASSVAPKAPGIVSSAPGPMLGKNEREALYTVWKGAQALLKAEEKRLCAHKHGAITRGYAFDSNCQRWGSIEVDGKKYCKQHAKMKGWKEGGEANPEPTKKSEETSFVISKCPECEKPTYQSVPYGDTGRKCRHCGNHWSEPEGEETEKAEGGVQAAKMTVTNKFHGAGKQLGPTVQVDKGKHTSNPPRPRTEPNYAKGEMNPSVSPRANRVAPCVCDSYKFPHRHKSGKCGKK
jgi:hypothetical protein